MSLEPSGSPTSTANTATSGSVPTGSVPTGSSRSVSRRVFLAGTGGAAAAAALSGCAISTRGVGATVLQVVTVANELPPEMIAQFEKANPDIRISLVQSSWDVVVSMLAAGTPPDLVRGAGASDTGYLGIRHLAAPIDDFIAKSELVHEDDLADVNDLWRWQDGKQGVGPRYGMVKDYSCDLTVWVEQDLLEKSGVDLPSSTTPISYDQMATIAKKTQLRTGGRDQVIGYGTSFGGKPDMAMVQSMLATAGTSAFNEDGTEIDLTTQPAQQALEFFIEIIRQKITPSFLSPQALDDTTLFIARRVAQLQSGYWTTGFVGTGDKTLKQNSYLLPAPQMGSTRVSPCVGGTGLWIPRASRKKEAAWRFMEWYFAGPPGVDRAKSGWGTPPLKSFLKYLPEGEPYQARSKAVQVSEAQYLKVLQFSPYVRIDAIGAALLTAFEQGITSGRSTQQMARSATGAINGLLAQARKKV